MFGPFVTTATSANKDADTEECCLVKERQRVVALHLYYRRAQEQEESDRKPDGRHALRDRSGEDLSGGFTSESIIFFGSKMASPSYTDLLEYADIKEQSFVDALVTTCANVFLRAAAFFTLMLSSAVEVSPVKMYFLTFSKLSSGSVR
uniref:Uncharacterized protein n=1 Tax=Timema tahoe TaxID=61484 RepID=A0A7R9IRH5_9NEOP|nr:unnamed protein product [Timema tahoe]